MVEEKKPTILFLTETKFQQSIYGGIKWKLGFANVFVVDSVSKSGGLALFWKEDISLASRITFTL